MSLPKKIDRVLVPPIKCQGIKTKLVKFIASNIQWDGNGHWIEPFLGSGVVLFNIQPQRARVCDSNPHIIRFYQSIYSNQITPGMVKAFLTEEGQKLAQSNGEYYYEVRQRFNRTGDPLDFLFLNRSCFNGVMRFNSRGEFNVPFCRKPDRFRQAYITKIVNQIKEVRDIMSGKDWEFCVGDWRNCLATATENDFVYLDPPYIGRHTDYFNNWSEQDAIALSKTAQILHCGVALSMWKKNKYRTNTHLEEYWNWMVERTVSHFYHVGSTEDLRNEMIEALMISPDHAASIQKKPITAKPKQLTLLSFPK